jgi:hypothetical protein
MRSDGAPSTPEQRQLTFAVLFGLSGVAAIAATFSILPGQPRRWQARLTPRGTLFIGNRAEHSEPEEKSHVAMADTSAAKCGVSLGPAELTTH